MLLSFGHAYSSLRSLRSLRFEGVFVARSSLQRRGNTCLGVLSIKSNRIECVFRKSGCSSVRVEFSITHERIVHEANTGLPSLIMMATPGCVGMRVLLLLLLIAFWVLSSICSPATPFILLFFATISFYYLVLFECLFHGLKYLLISLTLLSCSPFPSLPASSLHIVSSRLCLFVS